MEVPPFIGDLASHAVSEGSKALWKYAANSVGYPEGKADRYEREGGGMLGILSQTQPVTTPSGVTWFTPSATFTLATIPAPSQPGAPVPFIFVPPPFPAQPQDKDEDEEMEDLEEVKADDEDKDKAN